MAGRAGIPLGFQPPFVSPSTSKAYNVLKSKKASKANERIPIDALEVEHDLSDHGVPAPAHHGETQTFDCQSCKGQLTGGSTTRQRSQGCIGIPAGSGVA